MNPSIQLAADVLRLVGPTRIAVVGAPDEALITQLWLSGAAARGFGDADALIADGARFDALLLCDAQLMAHSTAPAPLLLRMRAAVDRYLLLLPMQSRAALAQAGAAGTARHWLGSAVQAGWRRSPAGCQAGDYGAANDPTLPALLLLERIDSRAGETCSPPSLPRQVRADFTFDAGIEAEALRARYALAVPWVRAGDTVVDCDCGPGEGTALLAAQAAGARYIGVDADVQAIAYAQAQFRHCGAEYHVADAASLAFLPEASVDLIVALDSLGDPPRSRRLIDAFARVLKPDGRIVAGVRVKPADASPPNWATLAACFDERFVIEKRYLQHIPGSGPAPRAMRVLQELPLAASADDADAWVIVAAANPLRARAADYRHPAFDDARRVGARVADFGAWYDNPWIYRSLVQMGERLTEPHAARALLLDLLGSARQDSADFGAAATVLTYAVMGGADRHDFADDLLSLATGYVASTSDNPHVRRWQISLGYAAAMLALSVGRRAVAADWFDRVQRRDAVAEFSPLLATKTVAAGYWAAMLALADRRGDAAREYLTRAVAAGAAALRADPTEAIGDPAQPLGFGFQELAEVADMTSQCALALRHLSRFNRAPGRFWATVDVRRFGLSSWAQAVQRENQQLQQWIAALQSMLAQTQTQRAHPQPHAA